MKRQKDQTTIVNIPQKRYFYTIDFFTQHSWTPLCIIIYCTLVYIYFIYNNSFARTALVEKLRRLVGEIYPCPRVKYNNNGLERKKKTILFLLHRRFSPYGQIALGWWLFTVRFTRKVFLSHPGAHAIVLYNIYLYI